MNNRDSGGGKVLGTFLARGTRNVNTSAVNGHPISSCLDKRVTFRMNRTMAMRNAIKITDVATNINAMRVAWETSVISSADNAMILIHDDRAVLRPEARRHFAHDLRNLEEVFVALD